MGRASDAGADVGVQALAALRATRETDAKVGNEWLPCIVGVPMPGERIGGKVFDGKTEAAVFPGDLPANPRDALEARRGAAPACISCASGRRACCRPASTAKRRRCRTSGSIAPSISCWRIGSHDDIRHRHPPPARLCDPTIRRCAPPRPRRSRQPPVEAATARGAPQAAGRRAPPCARPSPICRAASAGAALLLSGACSASSRWRPRCGSRATLKSRWRAQDWVGWIAFALLCVVGFSAAGAHLARDLRHVPPGASRRAAQRGDAGARTRTMRPASGAPFAI